MKRAGGDITSASKKVKLEPTLLTMLPTDLQAIIKAYESGAHLMAKFQPVLQVLKAITSSWPCSHYKHFIYYALSARNRAHFVNACFMRSYTPCVSHLWPTRFTPTNVLIGNEVHEYLQVRLGKVLPTIKKIL